MIFPPLKPIVNVDKFCCFIKFAYNSGGYRGGEGDVPLPLKVTVLHYFYFIFEKNQF
jgi:hypothetical protein